MRIDCYNASECSVIDIQYGDTFYYNSELYMRVSGVPVREPQACTDICWAVSLSTGALTSFNSDISVIFADTKVVVNTRDIQ